MPPRKKEEFYAFSTSITGVSDGMEYFSNKEIISSTSGPEAVEAYRQRMPMTNPTTNATEPNDSIGITQPDRNWFHKACSGCLKPEVQRLICIVLAVICLLFLGIFFPSIVKEKLSHLSKAQLVPPGLEFNCSK